MNQTVYRERVVPSWSSFLIPPLLGLGLYGVFLQFDELLGIWLGCAATSAVTILLVLKAPVIELTDTTLRVGRAVIERKHLGEAISITAEEAFAERGHLLDARAFTVFQSSVRTMVKLPIKDDSDPTPYWLFSSRNPERLLKLLAS